MDIIVIVIKSTTTIITTLTTRRWLGEDFQMVVSDLEIEEQKALVGAQQMSLLLRC